MNAIITFLSKLKAAKNSTHASRQQEPKSVALSNEFQIGDRVKKQVFVRYTATDNTQVIKEDFRYGTIIYVENGYASVRYKRKQQGAMEMFSDLTKVSEREWKQGLW